MAEFPFTAVDVIILLIVLLSGVLALVRGLVHELFSFGSLLGAAACVFFGVPLARPYVQELISDPFLADLAAGVGIFVVALIIATMITHSISRHVKDSALNALDRSLGFVFGLARGVLVVCLLYLGVEWLVKPEDQPIWLRDARAMPVLEWGADTIRSVLPGETEEKSARAAEDVRDEALKALETQRLLRDIISPEPKAPPPSVERGANGYSDRERREMERLLDSGQ